MQTQRPGRRILFHAAARRHVETERGHEIVKRGGPEVARDQQLVVAGAGEKPRCREFVDQGRRAVEIGRRRFGKVLHDVGLAGDVPRARGRQQTERQGDGVGGLELDVLGALAMPPPFRDRRGELRAHQHRAPGHIHPDQKERHCRHGAVDRLEGREVGDVEHEEEFQDLEEHRRDQRSRQCVPPVDPPVRHDDVDERESDHGKQEGQEPQEETDRALQDLDLQHFRRGEDVARDREAAADEERRQCQDRPVGEEADAEAARFRLPPDDVEGLLDGAEEHQRRDHQDDDADRGELAGIGDELGDLLAHDLRGGGHEILEEEFL